jgi:nucleoside-diphosphate-sugar epimerase
VTADLLPGADRALDASDTAATAAVIAEVRPGVIVHLAAGLDRRRLSAIRSERRASTRSAPPRVFAAAETARAERGDTTRRRSPPWGRRPSRRATTRRLNPGNVYGATKAFCEHLAAAMSTRPGAPAYLGLRFGYRLRSRRACAAGATMQSIIERAARRRAALHVSDYPDPLDWTWIDDAAEVLLARSREAAAAQCGGQRGRRQAATCAMQSRICASASRPSTSKASLPRRRLQPGDSSTTACCGCSATCRRPRWSRASTGMLDAGEVA